MDPDADSEGPKTYWDLGSGIRDLGSEIRDGQKSGSGIRDPG